MRILIVDAFAGSTSGRQAFLKYEKLVRSAFQAVEPHEQGRAEIIVRHYRKLEVRLVLRVCWEPHFATKYNSSYILHQERGSIV